MKCSKCKSSKVGVHDRNATPTLTRVKCRDCGHTWTVPHNEAPGPIKPVKNRSTDTITIDELRKRHDVDYKVSEALKSLNVNEFIEKDELIKRIGLRHGYPRLSATIDSYKEFQGKADSKVYYGHPDSIAELKEEGVLF